MSEYFFLLTVIQLLISITKDAIGIKDISKPNFGDAVTINSNEIPVFWACGVTPQVAVMNAK